jgi:hypothetical protein
LRTGVQCSPRLIDLFFACVIRYYQMSQRANLVCLVVKGVEEAVRAGGGRGLRCRREDRWPAHCAADCGCSGSCGGRGGRRRSRGGLCRSGQRGQDPSPLCGKAWRLEANWWRDATTLLLAGAAAIVARCRPVPVASGIDGCRDMRSVLPHQPLRHTAPANTLARSVVEGASAPTIQSSTLLPQRAGCPRWQAPCRAPPRATRSSSSDSAKPSSPSPQG